MENDSIEQQVIDLFINKKMSLYKIQKELKIDYHKVRRILSANNIDFPTMATPKIVDELNVIKMYTEEKMTLRMIADQLDIDHHRVARILNKNGVIVTTEGRSRKPFSSEHRRKISESTKGRASHWKGKSMPKTSVYKNMLEHLQWDIDLEFLLQFQDIEKLKVLNGMLTRDRVSKEFDTNKYKKFIEKFYSDIQFNKVYDDYIRENKKSYSAPSLDHIIPLSKGGTWDLDNLQVLSWVVNRAKYNFTPDEWDYIKGKYFRE